MVIIAGDEKKMNPEIIDLHHSDDCEQQNMRAQQHTRNVNDSLEGL